MKLPDPAEQPTLPAWPVLGEAFGRRRSAVYELCRRATSGEPEVLPVAVHRVGSEYRVATGDLRRVLGLEQEAAVRLPDNDGRRAREPGAAFTPTTASPLHEQRSARMLPRRGVIADRAAGER
jgi:hypothetical protein